jgi:hypothetical protein
MLAIKDTKIYQDSKRRKDTKNFSGHTVSKFFRNFYVLPEFRIDFCPAVKILGGTCPAPVPPPPPRPIRLCYYGCHIFTPNLQCSPSPVRLRRQNCDNSHAYMHGYCYTIILYIKRRMAYPHQVVDNATDC